MSLLLWKGKPFLLLIIIVLLCILIFALVRFFEGPATQIFLLPQLPDLRFGKLFLSVPNLNYLGLRLLSVARLRDVLVRVYLIYRFVVTEGLLLGCRLVRVFIAI